jgi:hypothetical protein
LYFCIGLYIVGFVKDDKVYNYLMIIDTYAKVVVSLFLMYKFNMFQKKIEFTEFDRSMVFQAGLFLFFTMIYNSVILYYINNLKTIVSKA